VRRGLELSLNSRMFTTYLRAASSKITNPQRCMLFIQISRSFRIRLSCHFPSRNCSNVLAILILNTYWNRPQLWICRNIIRDNQGWLISQSNRNRPRILLDFIFIEWTLYLMDQFQWLHLDRLAIFPPRYRSRCPSIDAIESSTFGWYLEQEFN